MQMRPTRLALLISVIGTLSLPADASEADLRTSTGAADAHEAAVRRALGLADDPGTHVDPERGRPARAIRTRGTAAQPRPASEPVWDPRALGLPRAGTPVAAAARPDGAPPHAVDDGRRIRDILGIAPVVDEAPTPRWWARAVAAGSGRPERPPARRDRAPRVDRAPASPPSDAPYALVDTAAAPASATATFVSPLDVPDTAADSIANLLGAPGPHRPRPGQHDPSPMLADRLALPSRRSAGWTTHTLSLRPGEAPWPDRDASTAVAEPALHPSSDPSSGSSPVATSPQAEDTLLGLLQVLDVDDGGGELSRTAVAAAPKAPVEASEAVFAHVVATLGRAAGPSASPAASRVSQHEDGNRADAGATRLDTEDAVAVARASFVGEARAGRSVDAPLVADAGGTGAGHGELDADRAVIGLAGAAVPAAAPPVAIPTLFASPLPGSAAAGDAAPLQRPVRGADANAAPSATDAADLPIQTARVGALAALAGRAPLQTSSTFDGLPPSYPAGIIDLLAPWPLEALASDAASGVLAQTGRPARGETAPDGGPVEPRLPVWTTEIAGPDVQRATDRRAVPDARAANAVTASVDIFDPAIDLPQDGDGEPAVFARPDMDRQRYDERAARVAGRTDGAPEERSRPADPVGTASQPPALDPEAIGAVAVAAAAAAPDASTRVAANSAANEARDAERGSQRRPTDDGASGLVAAAMRFRESLERPNPRSGGSAGRDAPVVPTVARLAGDTARTPIEPPPSSVADRRGERFEALPAPADERSDRIGLGGVAVALNDSQLDTMRGGFETDAGLQISFGIERAVYINGSLVTTTRLNVDDLSRVSGAQAASHALDRAAIGILQSGPNNVFSPGQMGSSSVATVIQNRLNDQQIQGITQITATVNSLDLMRRSDVQSRIQSALTDSIRR